MLLHIPCLLSGLLSISSGMVWRLPRQRRKIPGPLGGSRHLLLRCPFLPVALSILRVARSSPSGRTSPVCPNVPGDLSDRPSILSSAPGLPATPLLLPLKLGTIWFPGLHSYAYPCHRGRLSKSVSSLSMTAFLSPAINVHSRRCLHLKPVSAMAISASCTPASSLPYFF